MAFLGPKGEDLASIQTLRYHMICDEICVSYINTCKYCSNALAKITREKKK
jgi:hypothetical protein